MNRRDPTRCGVRAASVLLFVLGYAADQAPAQAPPGVLRIGSWNIEHLGEPGARRGSGMGILQKPADLAHYIRSSKVDVLALQEITADAPAPPGFPRHFRTSSILKKVFAELDRTTGNDWQHVLFPKMRAADSSQWTGVAWKNARVKPVGSVFQVPLAHDKSTQGYNRWDRNLHALKFSAGPGKTDFVVLVVHLKANAQNVLAQHRAEEIADFVKALPALRKAFPDEGDWVLLGDTNITGADEPAVAALVQAGFRDLNKDDRDTHTAKGVQPFDRIFVPQKQPEFSRSTLEVLSAFQKLEKLSFADYRARYSDHYMIATTIQIMADDD